MNIVDVSRMWTIFTNNTTIYNTWKGLIKEYLKLFFVAYPLGKQH